MSQPMVGTPKNGSDGALHEGGRMVTDRNGTLGVSDERRLELEHLEQEAGTEHEDDSLGQRPQPQQGPLDPNDPQVVPTTNDPDTGRYS